MRCIFFIALYLLSVVFKKANAFTPTDCLKKLTNLNEKKVAFTGRDNVYCAYLRDNTIENATFKIKDSDINDWEITVGQWDKQNLSVDNSNTPVITKENNKYKLSTSAYVNNLNAIIWISKNDGEGEITNVKIRKTLEKRDNYGECLAFNDNVFTWRDISWDNTNEKYIGNGIINLNNTVYLDTLALLFKKKPEKDRGVNNYFTGDFSIVFKMRSDTSEWMVYAGAYDKDSKEVEICHEWDLDDMGLDISINRDAVVKLSPEDESDCYNNIIWWQSVKSTSVMV